MGDQSVERHADESALRDFVRSLLRDVQALDKMITSGAFEEGVRTIGAEQELFLVDRTGRPAPVAEELLERVRDEPRIVNEIARFNIEANASPRAFGGNCLRELEGEVLGLVARVREVAAALDAEPVMAGILPTLEASDLGLENMTPSPRYARMNEVIRDMNGGFFRFRIKGLDELDFTHDNVMVEAANTSFQMHFEVGPREFARFYNLSQLVTGPVLAAAVNSPMLLGRRLWQETRVAVFQQSIDARSAGQQRRGHKPRVDFGDRWVDDSVLEILREDIARFRVVLAAKIERDSLDVLKAGGVPDLKALRLHNGTVYRWNRPCYGISDNGKPHLRIEMRALPAGPSVRDEIANAALFYGLLSAYSRTIDDVRPLMPFDEAKGNFLAASRFGLHAQMTWLGGKVLPASQLLREELIPTARAGLASAGIDTADIDTYLGCIEERVARNVTGSTWALGSFASLPTTAPGQRRATLVRAMINRQAEDTPVHEWKPAGPEEAPAVDLGYRYVGQFMTTDLFTVRPFDLVDLAACVMTWERIRHVPVEDDDGRVVGLVSHRALLRVVAEGQSQSTDSPLTVADIMRQEPVTVQAHTPTLEAIDLMRRHRVGCLPVVAEDGTLVGIVTERDLVDVARQLLEERLRAHELAAPSSAAAGSATEALVRELTDLPPAETRHPSELGTPPPTAHTPPPSIPTRPRSHSGPASGQELEAAE